MSQQGAIMIGVRFREILRLRREGHSQSSIALACGCSRSTVQDYLGRASAVGLAAETIAVASDSELLGLLGKKSHREQALGGPEVDWSLINTELRRPGVTLALL